MTGGRTSWRSLVMILQVVAFLALTAVSAGHAHGGARVHGGAHAHGGVHAATERPVTVAESAIAESTIAGSAISDRTAGLDAPSPVCGPECCHVHPMRPACPALSHDRTFGRMLTPARAVPFASLSPERQPEPPRPRA